jgi:hypothetical protein
MRTFCADGKSTALTAGAADDCLDARLSGLESMAPLAIANLKPFEVSETVVEDTHHLPRQADWARNRTRSRAWIVEGGRDLIRVTPQAGNFRLDLFEVSGEDE